MNPSELYIPDGSEETLIQRGGNHYGYLPNEHEVSLVCIELFIPYFETDLFVIDHHTCDLYLYDRDNRGVELLAIQASTLPISVDRAKMMAQMCANSQHLALLNRSTSRASYRASSQVSRLSSRASSRAK